MPLLNAVYYVKNSTMVNVGAQLFAPGKRLSMYSLLHNWHLGQ